MVIGIIINVIVFIILLYDLKTTKYISYEYVHKVRTENGWEIVPYKWVDDYKLWQRIKLPLYLYLFFLLVAMIPYIGMITYFFAYLIHSTYNSYNYYYEYTVFHRKVVKVWNKVIKLIFLEI